MSAVPIHRRSLAPPEGRLRSGWRRSGGSGRSQQRVPHRAFGPVRNDKGCWWGMAVFRSAEAPIFHGGAWGRGDLHFNSNVKGDGQSLP